MAVRVRVDPSYLRDAKKLDRAIRKRAARAIERFMEHPEYPGLNFEAIRGEPDYFSIRVNLNFRIVLRREQDHGGVLYAAVRVGTHQVYRRR